MEDMLPIPARGLRVFRSIVRPCTEVTDMTVDQQLALPPSFDTKETRVTTGLRINGIA